jgi:hypothetical protein
VPIRHLAPDLVYPLPAEVFQLAHGECHSFGILRRLLMLATLYLVALENFSHIDRWGRDPSFGPTGLMDFPHTPGKA